jgi:hypothetical protein
VLSPLPPRACRVLGTVTNVHTCGGNKYPNETQFQTNLLIGPSHRLRLQNLARSAGVGQSVIRGKPKFLLVSLFAGPSLSRPLACVELAAFNGPNSKGTNLNFVVKPISSLQATASWDSARWRYIYCSRINSHQQPHKAGPGHQP